MMDLGTHIPFVPIKLHVELFLYLMLPCSSILLARRYCEAGGVWGLIDFSGCTLISPNTLPFLLMTYRLTTPADVPSLQDQLSQEVGFSACYCMPQIFSLLAALAIVIQYSCLMIM